MILIKFARYNIENITFKNSYECFIFCYDKSYTRSGRHIIPKLVNELHSHVTLVTTIIEYPTNFSNTDVIIGKMNHAKYDFNESVKLDQNV